jgi:hypothetical protein
VVSVIALRFAPDWRRVLLVDAIKNEFRSLCNEMLTRLVPHPMIGGRRRAPGAALALRMK